MARNFYSGKDSHEEEYFQLWLEELIECGYIDSYTYQPEPFKLNDTVKYNIKKQMKTKVKVVERTLLQSREYTPDYLLIWNKKAENVLYQNLDNIIDERPIFIAQNNITYLDVKGTHNQHSSWQIFEANRKTVWEKYGIFIEKIQPYGKKTCLFGNTFTPRKLPMWQKKDPTKLYSWAKKWEIRYIEEFLNNFNK